jgi:hypothetical protein
VTCQIDFVYNGLETLEGEPVTVTAVRNWLGLYVLILVACLGGYCFHPMTVPEESTKIERTSPAAVVKVQTIWGRKQTVSIRSGW